MEKMKIRKTTTFSIILACFIVAGTATAFATSANAQPQQADSVEQDGKIEIVSKPDSIMQISDSFGTFLKMTVNLPMLKQMVFRWLSRCNPMIFMVYL